MRSFLRRQRWRRDDARFMKRFSQYLKDGISLERDHELLLSAFLASQGSSLTWANQLESARRDSQEFSSAPDILGYDECVVQEAAECLNEYGYYLMPIRLPEATRSSISTYLEGREARLVSDDPAVNGKHSLVDFARPSAEVYQIEERAVVASADVQKLLVDRMLLTISQRYLGTDPLISNAMAWFSFAHDSASAEGAQQFHFDLERVKWVKVFIFLTDVGIDNGPHMFIPGTHRDGAIPQRLLDSGYDRMPDQSVCREFAEGDWKTMTGSAGTILFEDTRGLHKGSRVHKGHRLVLQFQYSSSFFGSICHFAAGYPAVCDEWAEFAVNYPRVLARPR